MKLGRWIKLLFLCLVVSIGVVPGMAQDVDNGFDASLTTLLDNWELYAGQSTTIISRSLPGGIYMVGPKDELDGYIPIISAEQSAEFLTDDETNGIADLLIRGFVGSRFERNNDADRFFPIPRDCWVIDPPPSECFDLEFCVWNAFWGWCPGLNPPECPECPLIYPDPSCGAWFTLERVIQLDGGATLRQWVGERCEGRQTVDDCLGNFPTQDEDVSDTTVESEESSEE